VDAAEAWTPPALTARQMDGYAASTRGRRVLTPCGAPKSKKEERMADFNLKPLEDRIVVKPGEEEQTTVSGIVIPDTAKEKPQEGSVVAVGPGRFEDGKRVPLDVKVGDKVIYSKYGGTEVKVEGDEYLILSARDVLAVVSK
jgi:chaperonin GroES